MNKWLAVVQKVESPAGIIIHATIVAKLCEHGIGF